MRHVSYTRSGRAGSLLILLSVLLLALAGVVYMAQPAEAQTPELTIVKEADPQDDTPFSFDCTAYGLDGDGTSSEVPSDFALTEGEPCDFTLRDPSADSHGLPIGFDGTYFYAITELVPIGWRLGHVDCTGPVQWYMDGPTLMVYPAPAGAFSLDQVVPVGPAVCTFFNEQQGRIIVEKVTSPVDAPDGLFSFHPSWGPEFVLAGGESHDSGLLPAGVYSVGELIPLPAGWSFGSVVCDDGSMPTAIGVSPGETVTCTFYNRYEEEEEGGSLTILKMTSPAGGTGFTFDGTLGPFTLDHGGSRLFDGLAAGPYSVSETPAAGWEFEDVVCYTAPGAAVDYAVVGAGVVVNLAEGQDVVCKFANREEETVGPEGSLTIVKHTVPAGGEGFAFDAGILGTFSLDDGGMETFTGLAAGAYVVTETPAAGWEFASVECDAVDYTTDGASVTVNLTEGEAAVCTFSNGELPYTGSSLWLPLLLAGLATLLAGLGIWVTGVMKRVKT